MSMIEPMIRKRALELFKVHQTIQLQTIEEIMIEGAKIAVERTTARLCQERESLVEQHQLSR
jgi:hypothetical protein